MVQPISTTGPRPARVGMTLVELLIVISLLVMLMAAALPLVRPLLNDRKVRETSRQLNAFFANAKSRALLSGRPVGVWIERNQLDPRAANRLFIAEVPPLYTGDLLGATASLEDENGDGLADVAILNSQFSFSAQPPTGFTTLPAAAQAPSAFIRPGDFIRFDYRGTFYKIQQIVFVAPNTIRVRFVDPEATWSPGPDGGWGIAGNDDDFSGLPADDSGERGWFGSDDVLLHSVSKPRPGIVVPYQVQRSPIKSIVSPLALPNGVVLDLGNSGMGTLGRQFGPRSLAPTPDLSPILIVFNPEGSVENIVLHDRSLVPTQTIHLLVGRTEKVGQDSENSPLRASAADATPIVFNRNLSDQSNQWFSVTHRTGVLSTTENGWQLASDDVAVFAGPTLAGSLQLSRQFAAELQAPIGGR